MDLGDLISATVLFACEIIASLLAVGALCLLGLCSSVLRELLHTAAVPWLKYDVSIMTAFALVAAAITALWTRLWVRSHQLKALILGALCWWLGLSLATAIWLPGASYLFVWPTLGSMLGLAIASRCLPGSPLASAANLLGAIPALLLLVPLIRTTFDGLSLPMTAPIMVFVVVTVGVLMPLWGPLILPAPEPEINLEREQRAELQAALEHAS